MSLDAIRLSQRLAMEEPSQQPWSCYDSLALGLWEWAIKQLKCAEGRVQELQVKLGTQRALFKRSAPRVFDAGCCAGDGPLAPAPG